MKVISSKEINKCPLCKNKKVKIESELTSLSDGLQRFEISCSTCGVTIKSKWVPVEETYSADTEKAQTIYNWNNLCSTSTAIGFAVEIMEEALKVTEKGMYHYSVWEKRFVEFLKGK